MNLVIKSLTHTYTNQTARKALSDINIDIDSGEFVAIIGSSGCGKSTLLRLLANLIQPTRGQILLDGNNPARARAEHRIAWMSQSPALLPWLNARANVDLARKFHNTSSLPSLTAEEALARVGLSDVREAYPNTLSGGMQQRLALARTLMLDAELWLMDEPFASLDELTRERLTVELLNIWQPLRPTVLWVTHNIYEAIHLSDRILVFSKTPGRLVRNISVKLARPRYDTDAGFQNLLEELRSALQEAETIDNEKIAV